MLQRWVPAMIRVGPVPRGRDRRERGMPTSGSPTLHLIKSLATSVSEWTLPSHSRSHPLAHARSYDLETAAAGGCQPIVAQRFFVEPAGRFFRCVSNHASASA